MPSFNFQVRSHRRPNYLSEISRVVAVVAEPNEFVVSLPMTAPLAARHLEADERTAAAAGPRPH